MKTESSNDNKELFSVDYIFGKQVQLKQMKTGYRFGSDAVLLASYIRADNGDLLDLGAGVGAGGGKVIGAESLDPPPPPPPQATNNVTDRKIINLS